MTTPTPPVTRPTLRTERIELRPMRPEHLGLLEQLDTDPEVMRHLLGRARTVDEIAEFWEPRCADSEADRVGLGHWVGFTDGEFLGWWAAWPPSPMPAHPTTAELGWRLRRAVWGQGLASEGAEAVVEHCFSTIGLERLWAETMAVNHASRGVMRKLGMRHVRTEVRTWDEPLPGADQGEAIYELTRDEWLIGRADRVGGQPR